MDDKDRHLLHVNLPSTSFVGENRDPEVASTCPLLTPSPPTNALVDPTTECPENSTTFISSNELTDKLNNVVQEDSSSSTSGSSALAEPAEASLLHNYLTVTKSGVGVDGIITTFQPEGNGQKTSHMGYSRKIENAFFFNWNWPVIRRIFVFTSLSSILAALVIVVSMVAMLPNTCNPPLPWYQGALLYEIFPASFQDSNGDGVGDFKGIAMRANYLENLNVRGIRLNSIFPAVHYPEDYHNVTSLFQIHYSLGSMEDFESMVNSLHARDIYVTLDLPVWPLYVENYEKNVSVGNQTDVSGFEDWVDVITGALNFWIDKGVDGFYLKGLEHYTHEAHFPQSLREWKLLIGQDNVLIANYDILKKAPEHVYHVLLNRIDLFDVQLNFEEDLDTIRTQIEAVHSGVLWSKPGMPWVHWSNGNVDTPRLSSITPYPNSTFSAIMIVMMLPGTPSIFYGNEIALGEVIDPNNERIDQRHLHQLTTMVWQKEFHDEIRQAHHLPWLPGKPKYLNFGFKDLIAEMETLRTASPAIYVNGIWKDELTSTCNAAVRYAHNNIIVIERWYPRRNSYVLIANLGKEHVTIDLSSLFYSGTVVIGHRSEKISFKSVELGAGESVVVRIDK